MTFRGDHDFRTPQTFSDSTQPDQFPLSVRALLDLSESEVFKIYFDLTQFDLNQRALLVTTITVVRQRGLAFMTGFRAAF